MAAVNATSSTATTDPTLATTEATPVASADQTAAPTTSTTQPVTTAEQDESAVLTERWAEISNPETRAERLNFDGLVEDPATSTTSGAASATLQAQDEATTSTSSQTGNEGKYSATSANLKY